MTLRITDYYTRFFFTFPVAMRLLFSMMCALVLIAHIYYYTAHKIQGMVNLASVYIFSKVMKSV